MDESSNLPVSSNNRSELPSNEMGKTSIESDQTVGFRASDMQALREDLDALKNSFTEFMAHAGGSVVGVASNAAEKSSVAASRVTQQVKTLGTELETVARENPIGAMSAALALGVVIGLVSRGRT